MRVRITRLDPAAALPGYQTSRSAGFDLAALERTVIPAGAVALIRTGLVIACPADHFLALFVRSSLPIRRGLVLANGVGVVDPDYCGPADEVKIALLNVTDAPVVVEARERVAQGIFLPIRQVSWEESEPASRASRGGFGSTGT